MQYEASKPAAPRRDVAWRKMGSRCFLVLGDNGKKKGEREKGERENCQR